jgi:hypothetical protein
LIKKLIFQIEEPDFLTTDLKQIIDRANLLTLKQGDQMSLLKKIAQNIAQPFFVKINTQL